MRQNAAGTETRRRFSGFQKRQHSPNVVANVVANVVGKKHAGTRFLTYQQHLKPKKHSFLTDARERAKTAATFVITFENIPTTFSKCCRRNILLKNENNNILRMLSECCRECCRQKARIYLHFNMITTKLQKNTLIDLKTAFLEKKPAPGVCEVRARVLRALILIRAREGERGEKRRGRVRKTKKADGRRARTAEKKKVVPIVPKKYFIIKLGP